MLRVTPWVGESKSGLQPSVAYRDLFLVVQVSLPMTESPMLSSPWFLHIASQFSSYKTWRWAWQQTSYHVIANLRVGCHLSGLFLLQSWHTYTPSPAPFHSPPKLFPLLSVPGSLAKAQNTGCHWIQRKTWNHTEPGCVSMFPRGLVILTYTPLCFWTGLGATWHCVLILPSSLLGPMSGLRLNSLDVFGRLGLWALHKLSAYRMLWCSAVNSRGRWWQSQACLPCPPAPSTCPRLKCDQELLVPLSLFPCDVGHLSAVLGNTTPLGLVIQ